MTFNNEQVEIPKKKANHKRNKKISVLIVFLLFILGLSSYMWYMNYGPFQGDRVAGVPDGHINTLDNQMELAPLIFSAHGGYAFNFHGKGIAVYLAYYERDVRKKHERVMGIQQTEEAAMNGTLHWGVTFEGDPSQLKELRVNLRTTNGAQSTNSYDLSQLNFESESGFSSVMNAFSDGRIESERRYALQTWQTSGTVRADNDVFHEEVLKESAQTVILYLVFE